MAGVAVYASPDRPVYCTRWEWQVWTATLHHALSLQPSVTARSSPVPHRESEPRGWTTGGWSPTVVTGSEDRGSYKS